MNESHHTPPAWIRKILGLLLEPRILEACLGDLEEKFQRRLRNRMASWQASLCYLLEAAGFLKLARFPNTLHRQITINMIGHTVLFFFRLVRKDKSYYAISLLALILSLASFLMLTLFIDDELSYDKFHENHNRIFRVTTHIRLNDVNYDEASSQFPAAAALKAEFPEVAQAVRIFPQDVVLEQADKRFEEHLLFADENLFDVFSFYLILGDPATALRTPNSIILTEATARKYFGNENPLSKTILLASQPLVVTGVMRNIPDQSHLKFTGIVPLNWQLNVWKSQSGNEGRENKWFWTGAYTYLLLQRSEDGPALQAKLHKIIDKYFPARYRENGRFELQAITDIHLRSHLEAEFEPGGSILYVRLFTGVAFVIMLVSSINLINLSYFKITSRIREVGIRKFLGQNTARIVAQLSLESVLLGVMAFALSIVVSQVLISKFNLLVHKNLTLWSGTGIGWLATSGIIIVGICLLAILRPAYRYANRSASHLLLHNHGKSASSVRNLLIGLQVCFSFVLLVLSFVIHSQIEFFRQTDLGFDRNNILVVRLNQEVRQKFESFKNEVRKIKDVVGVTSAEVPGEGYNGWRFVPEGGSYEKPLMLPFTFSEPNFLSILNIKLVQGRDFDPQFRNDSLWQFLINKRAAVELGWQGDALGRKLEVFAPGTTEIMAKGVVIGVVEDYHFESLHHGVKPVVITVGPAPGPALIRLSGPVNDQMTAAVGAVWKKFSDRPFSYVVLDQKLDKLYANEEQLGNIILFFTIIALYLTCYGLFAMSSLLFSSRLKEVAIRKVFGADQLSIVRQFYGKYAVFNLSAIIAGLPVAIYIGRIWLDNFQYRVPLSSGFFIEAAICVLAAGLLSVTYYLARVAFSSPIRFLRSE